MTRDKLSPHFGAAEFDCHNGQEWPAAARPALVLLCREYLEPLRARFGPVKVTSGFRPAVYNRSVGGAPLSYHRYELRYGPLKESSQGVGLAADVEPSRGSPVAWAQFLDGIRSTRSPVLSGRGAFVAYPSSGFTHVDSGPRRSWAA